MTLVEVRALEDATAASREPSAVLPPARAFLRRAEDRQRADRLGRGCRVLVARSVYEGEERRERALGKLRKRNGEPTERQ